ncbi:Hint domain-containing protein [Roseovarius sp. THAF9]|uniref:Hint domain-containing protein n=1 Tax=Roseovarius sp. THAF9 TaxID=2587847 RepID=UPI0012686A44|nr:Hint domain-containing protein [Roseovarius sp. THAF9]
MSTYTVTIANWNDAAFWAAISETAGGHTLDFSALPANYAVDIDKATGRIILTDGTTTFTVGEAGFGGVSDASLGGTTLLDYFETLTFGDGDHTVTGDASFETITSGSGTDSIDGGGGDDSIDAGGGDDTVDGGQGNDLIQGGDGNDLLFDSGTGGANTETIHGGSGNDTIDGGERSDTVYGGDGDDLILDSGGAASDDTLYGEAGNDTIYGGTREDLIDGGADDDHIFGGDGSDTILGGTGNDRISADDFTPTGPNLIVNGSFEDTTGMTPVSYGFRGPGGTVPGWTDANGSSVDYHNDGRGGLTATDGANWLDMEGGAGEQLVISQTVAGLQPDGIYQLSFDAGDLSNADDGTAQDNTIDVYWNGQLIDSIDPPDGGWQTYTYNLVGGAGDGTGTLEFRGAGASDSEGASLDSVELYATTETTGGNDSVTAGDGNDTILAGAGDDTVFGGTGADLLTGGSGADTIEGGADADTFVLEDGFGSDVITGGEGVTTGADSDTIDGGALTGDATVTFDGDEQGSLTDGTDTLDFSQVENVFTGTGDDSIDATSDSAGVGLFGGAGTDTITGGSGADYIEGGDDADLFLVEEDFTTTFGDDTIIGGEGTTTGADEDTVDFSAKTSGIDVTYTGNEAGTADEGAIIAQFSEIENLTLTNQDDTVDAGADSVGVDIDALDGDDSLIGGQGDDVLNAGTGADTVAGGAGNDQIDLGAGDGAPDTVVVSDGDGADTVTGFEGPIDNGDGTFTGQDQLDFSGATDADGNPLNTRDVTVGDDGFGNALLSLPNGDSITLVGIAPADVTDEDALAAMGVPAPDDIVEGTAGADNIDASYTGDPEGDAVDGADNATGTDADSIVAGAGNDTVHAGADNDTVQGEAGNDSLFGSTGNDSLDGGLDNDTLFGQDGDDTLVGGTGNDSLDGDDAIGGDDSIDGGSGDDTLIGDDGNDTLLGGDGADDIYASGGDNLIDGGDGADEVFAGSGNDTITVDQGDTVLGAGGDDTFTLRDLDTTGTGNAAISITGGESGETNGDTLILTSDVSQNDITFSDSDPGTGMSGSFTMADGTPVTFSEIENIICFTPGTMILTSHGDRAIETLQPGDMVVTRDQGLRPIRWIGKRTVQGHGRFAPIRVGANALDPTRKGLLVSPQHRILYTGYRAELLFGESEVLVPAQHLVDGRDVLRQPRDEVTYIHLMFDHHEVIYAEGFATESFHAGDVGLGAIEEAAREELFALFPELRTTPGHHLETARTCLKKHEAALLIEDTDGPHY